MASGNIIIFSSIYVWGIWHTLTWSSAFGLSYKAISKMLARTQVSLKCWLIGQGLTLKLMWLLIGFSSFWVVEPRPWVSCWLPSVTCARLKIFLIQEILRILMPYLILCSCFSYYSLFWNIWLLGFCNQ